MTDMDNRVLKEIEKCRLIPVAALDDAKDALPLTRSLMRGGIMVIEVTFRTKAAAESIRTISSQCPEILVGAGTIVNVKQASQAVFNGAEFLVSPGFSESVAKFALESGISYFPGVCTPSDIMKALEYNLNILKFFPASNYGGINTIKALSGPFPQVRFIPTGGINFSNMTEYLAYPKVVAVGGSWMVKKDLISEGRFDEIERITHEAHEAVRAVIQGNAG